MTARKTKRRRVIMRCTACGSADVSRTAEAEWNARRQAWQLLTVYDDATCNACGGECSLYESAATKPADVSRELRERAAIRSITQ